MYREATFQTGTYILSADSVRNAINPNNSMKQSYLMMPAPAIFFLSFFPSATSGLQALGLHSLISLHVQLHPVTNR